MPRQAKELKPLALKQLKAPGMYPVGGAPGLHLQVLESGAQTWILRATVGKNANGRQRRREIGLGGHPAVSLADAREQARQMRLKIAQGIDPLEERRAARSAALAGRGKEITFVEAAKQYIADHTPRWKNDKHAAQWTSTLETYAEPIIGKLYVRDIELAHVKAVIGPDWSTKNETMSRVRGRIEAVIDWAKVHGYSERENPARWKGHLDKVLPKPTSVKKVVHRKALAIDDMPAFMKQLRSKGGTGARALEFLALTLLRPGEVAGARWSEIDLKQAIWIVPAERMKIKKAEHRVPLSPQAVALLRALPRLDDNDAVFPGAKGESIVPDTLKKVMTDMGITADPHGLRSTFRDWSGERTAHPHEVAEMALAHTIRNKTEAAYRRGDLFEKRRTLMADWARFCYPKK